MGRIVKGKSAGRLERPAWARALPGQTWGQSASTVNGLCAQEPLEELEGGGAGREAAPPDAVLEPEQPADGLAKCLPLFSAGSGHRRFIRTLKPLAGSSFKARLQFLGTSRKYTYLYIVKVYVRARTGACHCSQAGCAVRLHSSACGQTLGQEV